MKNTFKRLPTNYWKKAGGEMLSFALIIPCILTLICGIIAAAQVSHINQTLSYCVYNACRAAAVSDSKDLAEERAKSVYANQMGLENSEEFDYEPCMLELTGDTWEKGAFVKCTVKYYIKTFMPFTSGIRTQSIVMMIENGGSS